ncbi:hypothetical protein ACFOHS_11610 [Jhaorihella thermophila]
MATERERRFVGPRRGQLIFAIFFFAVSALLLALIGSETQWVKKRRNSWRSRGSGRRWGWG